MTRRRILLAAGLVAALAALAVSCSNVILGADAQARDVVADMCKCQGKGELGFLGASCDMYLRGQLDGVTDQRRAEWIANYAAHCGDCTSVLECFYTAPTCATLGCTSPEECCTYRHQDGGCSDAGQCY